MADLEMNQITKSFGEVTVLKDVTLHCNRGEVHALLGENGAGKSTLLKVLSGAHLPDAGEIKLFGKKAEIRNPNDAMRYGIGTVYQELSVIPELTVSENIFVGRIPKRKTGMFDRKKLEEDTRKLFEEYGIDDIDPNAKARSLSLSQKQIVEILKTLAKNPEIIILDEATSALTDDRVVWLLGVARKLADQGRIVLFISHRMAEIQYGCDMITILRNGENSGEVSAKEIDMDDVISKMLGRKMAGYFPEITSYKTDDLVMQVRNLTYLHVLNGVDLDVYRGEVLGIGGLAGQGQAELLQALYGVLKTKGEVRLKGKSIRLHSVKSAIRNGIALIPEERAIQGLILRDSIRYNISLPILNKISNPMWVSQKKEYAVVDKYMKELQIKADSREMAAINLSGGNQQKVVMAKILAMEPEVFLMHDITRGVDIGTKKEMFHMVREFAKEGHPVIFFSTDVEELVNVCDRVAVMYDGKIQADLQDQALTRENIIKAAIGNSVDDETAVKEGA
ncbi:MAG: sugar ABC transporter ATP-binding protein [Lachnospiraceae bacterium]|nr:sugar ABC transporter ATP-binding protein [Lachnospiraceae bacterium]